MSCPGGIPDWSNFSLETFNLTLVEHPELCTVCTCPLEVNGHQVAYMGYVPSLGGNVFFAIVFGIALLFQLYLGFRNRTWGYLIGMGGGLILEVIGYAGRVVLRDHMFEDTYFIMSLVCLTIGPAFLAAAIYLSLSRMVIIYAPERSLIRPQIYTYIFITGDLIALLLQAAGGAVASLADFGSDTQRAGINTMIAGVAWQVFVILLFGVLSLDFWLRGARVARKTGTLNPDFASLRARKAFEPGFVVAVFLAVMLIFVRSVFRCAELSEGFDGPLANDQVTFMVLEGTMVALACILLTVAHPGITVGRERWHAASWKANKVKKASDREKTGSDSSS
ncbi:hypothetical protein VTJ83DRAFT_2269 [Remersonia thermophila]|uniref:Sphingoid long-chain base transporter RSB1 n=1 Tax=Remersonia thermophila TaxID=72144 RepID=A0ABR4DIC7_9PEZI